MPLRETDEALDIALDDADGEPYINVISICKACSVLYIVTHNASTLKMFLPSTLSHGTSPVGIVVPCNPPPEFPPHVSMEAHLSAKQVKFSTLPLMMLPP